MAKVTVAKYENNSGFTREKHLRTPCSFKTLQRDFFYTAFIICQAISLENIVSQQ